MGKHSVSRNKFNSATSAAEMAQRQVSKDQETLSELRYAVYKFGCHLVDCKTLTSGYPADTAEPLCSCGFNEAKRL